ncbi:GPALPP motifs-containing protein 1 [Trichoplax sp. H2]|nr:GPALPP motifs-containing protein 1 [Trichoplax sp. H2]|eukprot:RDD46128.1 GPALPP motifs-containing protein 1 [Trichoplax sp. H2]
MSSSMTSKTYGPLPPPSCTEASPTSNTGQTLKESTKQETTAVATYGPILPSSHASNSAASTSNQNDSPESEQTANEAQQYGPALPPGFALSIQDQNTDNNSPSKESKYIGPIMPYQSNVNQEDEITLHQVSNDDTVDDDFVGPLPEKINEKRKDITDIAMKRERQFLAARQQSNLEEAKSGRESWMTDLPASIGNQFGLGPRQFRRNESVGKYDPTSWTETPSDKAKKMNKEKRERKRSPIQPDVKLSDNDSLVLRKIDDYNKHHRKESLIDLHVKRKRDEEPEDTKKERRPFDREKDLNHSALNATQRRSVINKAKKLDSRFSRSATNAFL